MTGEATPARRSYLFLQGMPTQFFRALGRGLTRGGHQVHRIALNGGDLVLWPYGDGASFRGRGADWAGFVLDRLAAWSVTDLVLFGDCRPAHAESIALARPRGVRIHVFEEGYLRPNWITLERDGVNARSSLPKDPQVYCERASSLTPWDGGRPAPGSFMRRAADACLYHAASMLLTPLYPHYETHRPWHPAAEFAGWIRKLVGVAPRARAAASLIERLIGSGAEYFVHPLQLDSDAQIRHHFELRAVRPAMEMVITSFARAAPSAARLVIKEHPLDNGLKDWRAEMRAIAGRLGIEDRVLFVAGGDLDALLMNARGVATVNSTVGLIALSLGVPVVALGQAVYNLSGLTYPGPLDGFWTDGVEPSAELFDAFRRVVARDTQINGGYFHKAAIEMAVAEVLLRWGAAAAVHAEAQVQPPTAEFAATDALSMAY